VNIEELVRQFYMENHWVEMDILVNQSLSQVKPLHTILEIGVACGCTLKLWEQLVPPVTGLVIGVDNQPLIAKYISGEVVLPRPYQVPQPGLKGPWEIESISPDGNLIKLRSDRQVYVVRQKSQSPEAHSAVEELLHGRLIDYYFHDGCHYGTTPIYDFKNYEDLMRTGCRVCLADVERWLTSMNTNAGIQALMRELPEPKFGTQHPCGMGQWDKPEGFHLDCQAIIEKYNLVLA